MEWPTFNILRCVSVYMTMFLHMYHRSDCVHGNWHCEKRNKVFLTLDTSYNPPENTIIVWFRNGQLVAKPSKFKADAENSGRYTCEVEGQETVQSHPVFLDVQCEFVNEITSLYVSFLEGFVYFVIYNTLENVLITEYVNYF